MAVVTVAAVLAACVHPAVAEPCLRGVNLSGAEFGGEAIGRPDHDYAYPSAEAFRAVAAAGATAVRLPFRWTRLQPSPLKPFDAGELQRLDAAVAAGAEAGLTVILDPHDFDRFLKLGARRARPPVDEFVDLWRRLATHFAKEPGVVFSLVNEPYDIRAADWAKAADAAIAAIRKAGALQFILVPGVAYTGAHSWASAGNAAEMGKVSDPLGRMAYDVHQYLDADSSGRAPECSNAERALTAIDEVGGWLKANGRRGFLGEFAASDRPECIAAMTAMATKLNRDPESWIGWTAWGAGAWWPADYLFNLEPTPAGERPQMAALRPLFADGQSCDLGSRP